MNWHIYFYGILISALLAAGCKKTPVENSYYKPYFERTKGVDLMSGVLDTIAASFEKHPPGIKDRCTYYNLRSLYHKNTGDFSSSLLALDSLKKLLDKNKHLSFYKEMYPAALLSMAQDYTELGLHDNAISLLQSANEFIGDNISNGCSSVGYHLQMAEILSIQGRNKMAIEYYLRSFEAAQPCTDNLFDRFYNSYSSLYNISHCYLKLNMYDSAQYYADSAMNYVTGNESKFPERADYMAKCKALINANIATVKTNLKQYDKAEQLLLSTIKETEHIYPSYALFCKLDLTNVYLKAEKLDKARQLLAVFDTIINKKDSSLATLQQKKRINNYKYIYYSKTGNYEAANRFAANVIQYYDSLTLARRKHMGIDPGLELEKKIYIAANDLLKVQNERKSLLIAAFVLLTILVLIIALFIWLHLKRAKRHSRMLEELNREIQLKNIDINDTYASLEKSYRANSQLMLTIAHDLRNLVVGIANLAKMTQRHADPYSKENLEYIVTAAVNASDLIKDVMNKSKETHEKNEVNDMLRLVRYCIEIMKPRAAQKHQKILLHASSVYANVAKSNMWRVITNLINNAIKFSHKYSTIEIGLQKQGNHLLLSVRDHGIGIPTAMMEKLFCIDPVIQRKGTAGEPSYGLGLKISKEIIEHLNGQFWVESEENKGSTFFILLPAVNNPTQ